MRRGHSGPTIIGVDMGGHTIKVAQLALRGGQYRVFALALLPRPQAGKEIVADDALALRNALPRHGFRGNAIAVAAPEPMLLHTNLEVPSKITGAPQEQVVRMELSRMQNLPPDSFEMAFWELRTAGNPRPTTPILAVGCPHEAANALLDVFEGAGFRVAALEVRGAAVARACRPLLLPAPQITALVDLGWRSTSVLFVCGQSLIYERSVAGAPIGDLVAEFTEVFALEPAAAYPILNAVGPGDDPPAGPYDAESLDVIRTHVRAHFDKLLEELRVPLSYANHQFPGEGVKRLLLTGGGAGVPGLAAYLAAGLGIEVKRAAPSDLLACPPELLARAGNPAKTCAVGLAQFGGAGR